MIEAVVQGAVEQAARLFAWTVGLCIVAGAVIGGYVVLVVQR